MVFIVTSIVPKKVPVKYIVRNVIRIFMYPAVVIDRSQKNICNYAIRCYYDQEVGRWECVDERGRIILWIIIIFTLIGLA